VEELMVVLAVVVVVLLEELVAVAVHLRIEIMYL
jgi:hypothetical protein